MHPIVGIPACARLVNGQLQHDTPARYATALLGGAGAVFEGAHGGWTLSNIGDLFQPAVHQVLDEHQDQPRHRAARRPLVGFLIAYARAGGTPRWVRSAFTTFSGVAANFGGIPLAFAFIATLGTIGIVTSSSRRVRHRISTSTASRCSARRGIEIVYLYFQIPLMILVIAPAIDGLRAEWREAATNLGASTFQYWRHVGLPVLMPSLLGAIILLFGNAFAAYATAYAPGRRLRPARADRDRHDLPGTSSRTRTGAGARLRDVRRPRRDDAVLRPAAAERQVGESERTVAPSAVVWLVSVRRTS